MLKANQRTAGAAGECLPNLLPFEFQILECGSNHRMYDLSQYLFADARCSMGLLYLTYKTGLFRGYNLAMFIGPCLAATATVSFFLKGGSNRWTRDFQYIEVHDLFLKAMLSFWAASRVFFGLGKSCLQQKERKEEGKMVRVTQSSRRRHLSR